MFRCTILKGSNIMIEKFIQIGRETIFLDFKQTISFDYDKIDLIRDIIAFANNDYEGDKFIVYGIKEKEGNLDIVGLDNIDFGDAAEYQSLLSEKVEPHIEIDFIKEKYKEKDFLILKIKAETNLRPFMVKNKYSYNESKKQLSVGEAWIRKGTFKSIMIRSDYENIYKKRVDPLVVRLRDNELFINNQDPARLEVIIKNTSDMQRVFTDIFLMIEDINHNKLTVSKMHRFVNQDKVQKGNFISDLSLTVPAKTEIAGTAEFDFNTSQAVIVGLNEYGEGETGYIFNLKFRYDIDREYIYTFENCSIYGKGAILRKVIGLRKRKI